MLIKITISLPNLLWCNMKKYLPFYQFLFLFFGLLICLNASEISTKTDFLYLGAISINPPSQVEKNTDEIDNIELLKFDYLDLSKIYPEDNLSIFFKGKEYKWSKDLTLSNNTSTYQLLYYATFIYVNQFSEVTLNAKSNSIYEIYVDGVLKTSKTDSESKDPKCQLNLEMGKHLVIIKSLIPPYSENPSLTLTAKSELNINANDFYFTTDPTRFVTFSDMLDNEKANAVSISADGNFAIISLTKRNKAKDATNNYFKIVDLKTNKEIQSFKGLLDLSAIQWAPTGNSFAYTTNKKGSTNLYISDLTNGFSNLLLQEIKDFGGFEWAPNGEFLVYTISEDKPAETTGLKKYNDMTDRYPWSGSSSYLYYLDVKSGLKYRLTNGKTSTNLNSISPDSKKLVFSESYFDAKNRPYSHTIYYMFDIESGKIDSLFKAYWGGNVIFSPDGSKLALTGGPSEFGNLGLNVPKGVIPNDYDNQLYIYDLSSKKMNSVSKDFNPSINSVYWLKDNLIYLTTVDGTREHLYSLNLSNNSYSYINLGVETLGSIAFDKMGNKAIYVGASVNIHNKVFCYDLTAPKQSLLYDPEENEYKNIKLGNVEDFNFINEDGKTIEGFLHFPPNFDETKSYPCIVYYYGGTSPVEREYEGRYPKNIWTANGYIVYILEPSGCTGYGQEFSAKHVNDWGTITAEEIIKGTKELLKKYKFIDKNRLGCIGASYGGFMTMNLITKTDMFAAAVSHAGISALSSYWGNGYWGFSYSAVATANSFPWNRRDIYVDNSSLFNADKIKTPLLLLHGGADTNVPTGESMQMYTALKLLGKDVEFIEVDGQDHHILEYNKRILWSKSILAYFDKYLKGQNSWWNSIYKN